MILPILTYTYRLTNTGNGSLSDIVAVDDRLGKVDIGSTSLAPEAWATGSLTYNVVESDLPGPLVNRVLVSGTPALGAVVTATDDASVALTVTGYRVQPSVIPKYYQPSAGSTLPTRMDNG